MDPRLEVRKRLRDDFEFYARHALKIKTKKAEILPLVLNRAQRHLLDMINRQMERRGYVRIIILKGRQMGLSTMIGGWLYWRASQHAAQKAIVITHETPATQNLFDMTKRYHKLVPDALKPSTSYNSRKELTFDVLDSSYRIVTAGGDAIGRGDTFTLAHLSEGAFWPKGSAKANRSGLLDAIPMERGTAVFDESTAQGMGGIFHDNWLLAVSGESDFEACFCPWYWDEGYRSPAYAGFERTPEEIKLCEAHDLDDDQLMFRRLKIAEKGVDLFKQEYPCTPEEAFLTTGRPVFHPERLMEMIRARQEPNKLLNGKPKWKDPIARMALEHSEWREHPRGELAVYREHDPAETYYIGADIGLGVQRDWSVAQIFDSERRQCAVWRGQVDPALFATILWHLGTHYNEALICPESNNHGILTCYRLVKDMNYPRVFQEVVVDKLTDTETVRIGFTTNAKTKPLVIDLLRERVREQSIEIYDQTTLLEMQSYIVTENGALEAEAGCFDDTVMALALCNYVNEGPGSRWSTKNGGTSVSSKMCSSCKLELPSGAFHKDLRRKDGLYSHCRDCHKSYTKAHYRARGRDQMRISHLKRKFGLTPAAFDAMSAAQGHACAICSTPFTKTAHIDHDHTTGAVRALLCGTCNRGIGLLQDNPGRLRAAADYLEAHLG